jgi:tetratricopeptide (TPR) repeat protein
MQVFSVKDVERVLRIPRSAIHSLVRGGFVAPARGRRRQYEFSFQDLVALRTARALMLARVSPRRISQALRQLRQSVPASPPSGNLRICASGTELVVRDESGPWRTPTGQFLLEFDVKVDEGRVQILERATLEGGAESADTRAPNGKAADLASGEAQPQDSDALFEEALQLEDADAEDAIRAYRRCLAVNPGNIAARINCGRLLHAAERMQEAEALYRAALNEGADDPNLLFNLALVLEDTGRELEAADMYRRALAQDENFADAHFNLARLYQQLQMPRAAIRHWNCYRRLTLSSE